MPHNRAGVVSAWCNADKPLCINHFPLSRQPNGACVLRPGTIADTSFSGENRDSGMNDLAPHLLIASALCEFSLRQQ
jgi:hypothetical protein